MTRNESGMDRIVRVVVGLVAAVLALSVGAGSVGGVILLLVAAIMLVTAAVGFCPLYRIFGMSTYRTSSGSR